MKIDWEKVWKDFDRHWETLNPHLSLFSSMVWTPERTKIQSLVESQLRKKVKRRKKP